MGQRCGSEDGGNLTGGMNRSLRALALSPFVGRRLAWFVAKERASDLERLVDLIEADWVTPSIVVTVDQTLADGGVEPALGRLRRHGPRGA